jgi:outer membrane receptor protein involved in Fe transport
MKIKMISYCRLALGCLLMLSASVTAVGQDSTNMVLKEVVLTATRTEQRIVALPYSLLKVAQPYLKEQMPRTTPEALQGINGVFVQKTNHGGGSAFVRGLTGNQTLLLIDGIRLNNATFRYGPNQYLNTVDPYTISHIEVAKGTGSVQYGTDALGGVIHLFTKEAAFSEKAAFHGSVTGKYITQDMEKTVRTAMQYSSKKVSFTGGFTYRNFGDLYGGDSTGRQTPTGYNEKAFDGKLRLLLNASSQLVIANQFVKQQHVPVYHKVALENFRLHEMKLQQRSLQYVRFVKKGNNRWVHNLEATASLQQGVEEREMQKNNNVVRTNERDKVSTLGFTLAAHSRISTIWSAYTGVETYLDHINSTREDRSTANGIKTGKRGLYPDGGKHKSYSVYSLHHITYNRWVINGGLRWNQYRVGVEDTTIGQVVTKPSAIVGNAGISYNVAGNYFVYANYSQGFRVPNLDDMGTLGIVDFRYEMPAYDLKPEKSHNIEGGFKFANKKLQGDVALYYMLLKNFITRARVDTQTINGYPVYRKINSDEGYIKGAETSLSWFITNTLSLQGNLAYAFGQNKSRNEPLRRIPPLNGRIGMAYRKKSWYTSAEMLFASKQDRLAKGDMDDNRIPKGGTPGWKVLNFYTGYQLKGVNMNVSLQNITNKDYRTHGSGVNGMGRSVWVRLSFSI